MTTKIIPTHSNFESIRNILKIPKNVTYREFNNNIDCITFAIKDVDYIVINYKSYLVDIDRYWKQFRGIIIKNYDHIVADSNGYTPTLTINQNIPNKGSIILTETTETDAKFDHIVDFTPGRFYLRPAFQGTMIRISLTDGVILRSTLRKGSIENSIWPTKEETKEKSITFAEKYDLLGGYGKELFASGKLNSPFCHIFLMCVPQVLSASHIECGEGFIVYLDTIKCYNPDKNDDTEEQESFLSKKIPDITEEEKKNGIITIKDQLFFPLNETDDPTRNFSKFIPPAIDIDFLKKYAAVFTVNNSMNNQEANDFLIKGISSGDLSGLEKINKLLLPGESLFYTGLNKKGQKVNYIISSECYNYRAAIIGDPNSMNQFIKLRQLPMDGKTIKVFDNTLNLDKLCFHDIAFPVNEQYYSLNPTAKFSDYNFDILHPSKTIIKFPKAEVDKITIGNFAKMNITAYFYLLALVPSRREHAYNFFQKIQLQLADTIDYIILNRKDLADTDSDLYKKKAMTYQKYFEASKVIRNIIDIASSTAKKSLISTSPTKKVVSKPFSLPQKKTLTPAPSTFKKSESNTDDTNIKIIIELLNEEDAVSLYRIISLIKLLKAED